MYGKKINEKTFLNKISKVVDDEFRKKNASLSTRVVAPSSVSRFIYHADKMANRMKAEVDAYIDLKCEMYKELINRLSEIE